MIRAGLTIIVLCVWVACEVIRAEKWKSRYYNSLHLKASLPGASGELDKTRELLLETLGAWNHDQNVTTLAIPQTPHMMMEIKQYFDSREMKEFADVYLSRKFGVTPRDIMESQSLKEVKPQ